MHRNSNYSHTERKEVYSTMHVHIRILRLHATKVITQVETYHDVDLFNRNIIPSGTTERAEMQNIIQNHLFFSSSSFCLKE